MTTPSWDYSEKIAAILFSKAKEDRKAIRSLLYGRRAQRMWSLLKARGYKKRFWMSAPFFMKSMVFKNLPLSIELMPLVELVNRNFPRGGACWSGTGKFKYFQEESNRADSAYLAVGFLPPSDHFLQIDITSFYLELEPYLQMPLL